MCTSYPCCIAQPCPPCPVLHILSQTKFVLLNLPLPPPPCLASLSLCRLFCLAPCLRCVVCCACFCVACCFALVLFLRSVVLSLACLGLGWVFLGFLSAFCAARLWLWLAVLGCASGRLVALFPCFVCPSLLLLFVCLAPGWVFLSIVPLGGRAGRGALTDSVDLLTFGARHRSGQLTH